MKSVFVLLALAAAAVSQRIAIGAPQEWTTITPGSNITVEVDRPDTLTGSQEVAISINLVSCVSRGGNCSSFDVTQTLGSTLYAGAYAPAFQPGHENKPPHQNFTVQVPSTLPEGQASLSVSHFSLVGAGPFPFLETQNVTLNLVQQSS